MPSQKKRTVYNIGGDEEKEANHHETGAGHLLIPCKRAIARVTTIMIMMTMTHLFFV